VLPFPDGNDPLPPLAFPDAPPLPPTVFQDVADQPNWVSDAGTFFN
jgi:hypothetical protein